MTCYDLRFPELARALVDRGAEVLVVPAAWVAGPRKVDHWRTLVRARAIENTVFVLAAGQPGPRYSGHSLVVDPLGDVLAEAGDGPEVLDRDAEPRGARRGPPYQPLAGQSSNVIFAVVSSPVPRRRAVRPPSRSARLRSRVRAPAPGRGVLGAAARGGLRGARSPDWPRWSRRWSRWAPTGWPEPAPSRW